MSKKDKITIMHTEDFSEIESELSSAMDQLDETNLRIEAMLQEHAKVESENAGQTDSSTDNATTPGPDGTPEKASE